MTDGDRTLSTSADSPRRAPGQEPALYLVLECDRPLAGAARYGLGRVDQILVGRGSRRRASLTEESGVRVVRVEVPDRRMSSVHARFERAVGRWTVSDAGSKNGVRVGDRPIDRAELADGDRVRIGHTWFRFRASVPVAESAVVDSAELEPAASGLASLSAACTGEIERLVRIAPSPTSVVLSGASGTGKELAARALHRLSGRRGRFVAVNCGALADELVESELFGHRKGAFSGAVSDHLGFIRSADGGTLFLDEIGDLPAPAQAALLRVLQEREVVPVGGLDPVPVDFRLVCATHRDLSRMSEEGRFRPDLRARISGVSISMPALQDRIEDLGVLVADLLPRVAGGRAERLSIDHRAAEALLAHDWPLNVRELEKALAGACALADDRILLQHLPEEIRDAAGRAAAACGPEEDEALRRRLVQLLRQHHGNVAAVARAMGKGRMQIHRWAQRFAIDLDAYR